MKKLVLISALFFALLSCKDSSKDEVSDVYPVVFKIGNVYTDLSETKVATTFASADSTLNKYGVLHYFVFDAAGKFVHQLKQVKGDSSFGFISDQLKIGQYTIVIISCTDEINVGANLVTLAATKVKSTVKSGDIFYKKFALTVTAEGVSKSVTLDRIVGSVEMRITDRIADNISRIELKIDKETPYFNLSTDAVETGNVEERSAVAEVSDLNRNSFSLGLLILNDQIPLTATVNLFDSSNVLVKSKRIPGLQNVRRKKLVLVGKVSDFMSAGFEVGYDETWSPDSTEVNF